jgi:hypothetical protein
MKQYGYEDVDWFTTTLWNDAIAYQVGFFVILVAVALIGHWVQNR